MATMRWSTPTWTATATLTIPSACSPPARWRRLRLWALRSNDSDVWPIDKFGHLWKTFTASDSTMPINGGGASIPLRRLGASVTMSCAWDTALSAVILWSWRANTASSVARNLEMMGYLSSYFAADNVTMQSPRRLNFRSVYRAGSSVDRAPGFYPGCRRFDSCPAHMSRPINPNSRRQRARRDGIAESTLRRWETSGKPRKPAAPRCEAVEARCEIPEEQP